MPYIDSIKRREYIRIYMRNWRNKNHDKALLAYRKTDEKNKEKRRAAARKYKKDKRPQMTALQIRRRISQMKRTPKWSDSSLIKKIYEKSAAITKLTGIRHEVDHIFPLQGKTVSGLHVPENLQILTKTENLQKGNRV